ncbi:MAG: glycine cleavage system aminomethyltransferase GcvT [Candidatus Bathyarchaeia archaeon]
MAYRTQLFQYHEKASRLTEFAGFQMPLWYDGIVSECLAVRNSVGVFDISHMGRIFVTGPDAEAFLNYVTTNNVEILRSNHAQYTLICNWEGGIKDDLVIMKLDGQEYLVVCNAGNRQKDLAWLQNNSRGYSVNLRDVSDEVAMISVQGPRAAVTVQRLLSGDLSNMVRFDCKYVEIAGLRCILSRTGYTGEDGFEICVLDASLSNPTNALNLWDMILKAGEEFGVKPCGLGARDVLRLEAGMCLYGSDITESTDPLEARLDFVVKLEKGVFIAKDAILKRRGAGVKRRRVGLRMLGKGIPREKNTILKDGKTIGAVTSGTYSPTLNVGVAMGYLPIEYSNIGERVQIDIHGKLLEAEVVDFPFYDTKLYGFKRTK